MDNYFIQFTSPTLFTQHIVKHTFSFCVQLCATLHVRMVRVLLMTLAVVQQDMWEQDVMKQVGYVCDPIP